MRRLGRAILSFLMQVSYCYRYLKSHLQGANSPCQRPLGSIARPSLSARVPAWGVRPWGHRPARRPAAIITAGIAGGTSSEMMTGEADLGPNTPTTQRLDHAVRMGPISAGLVGTSIGTLYSLTPPAQTSGIAGAIITAITPRSSGAGTALGAGVRTVTGIVSLSSYQCSAALGDSG